MLIAYVAGGWLSYVQAPALCAAITVLFFVTFIFLPDTPQKLLLQNNEEVIYTKHFMKRNILNVY